VAEGVGSAQLPDTFHSCFRSHVDSSLARPFFIRLFRIGDFSRTLFSDRAGGSMNRTSTSYPGTNDIRLLPPEGELGTALIQHLPIPREIA